MKSNAGRPFLAVALLLFLALPTFAATRPLPGLADPAAWRGAGVQHDGLPGWLRVGFHCDEGNTGQLLLREPVPLPEWVTGFNFLATNNGPLASLRIAVAIRDSKGREYLYDAVPPLSYGRGRFIPEHSTCRSREMLFSVPGLARPKLEPQAGSTIAAVGKHRVNPEAPLQLLGLHFQGHHQREQDQQLPQFLFRNFVLTGLTPGNTRLYYQFMDQELYGEVVPRPYLTPGQFGSWWGRRFDVSWEVVADYAGQPVLAGSKSFVFMEDIPMEVQLAEHIEIPVTAPGTWWVRAKLRRWGHGTGIIPDSIAEHEYRLYVHKSDDVTVFTPISAESALPGSYVRIAPSRASLVFAPDEDFVVPVQFHQPVAEFAGATCQVEARRGQGGELVRELTQTPAWADGRFVIACDLRNLPPGAYEVTGKLLVGERLLDKTTRLVGRQVGGPTTGAPNSDALAFVPSWQELLRRDKPLFHLTPVLPDNGVRSRHQEAWDEHFQPFLDHAAELSRDVELQVPWKVVEPLPGVYDWRTVDRFLDHADRKRLQVVLYPEYRSKNVPEWMPSVYEEDAEGRLFGHGSYLFHGARPNMFHALVFRERLMALFAAMVERYRDHPGLQGYYTCLEHPGDAPYKGWREGYSPESRQAWIAYARETWQTLEAVNERWQTEFASWDDIDHPPTSRGKVADRSSLDWLLFRTRAFEGFLKEIVETIRARDSHRLIIVYGDGVNDLAWFGDRGCISANGGSHDVMQWGIYAQHGLMNYPMRTEDHSPGNWSGYFPTQMDASVFAMMAGGGGNALARAFIRTGIPWQEYRDVGTGRGRFRRFQPIWEELRQAEALPIETFVYNTIESYLAEARTTFLGSYNSPWQVINLQAAQVPFSYGPPELWQSGKLLVLTNQRRALERAALDRIAAYVENGGTVLMQADYGRRNIDAPDDDWALLRRFGFTPPAAPVRKDRHDDAIPAGNGLLAADAKPFRLRDTWAVLPRDDMQTVAFFGDAKSQAALSWKPFGEGKVAVLWAQTIVPPLNARGSYPFLRDVAAWAGAALHTRATSDLLWTNLLRHHDGQAFYGLAHVGSWQGRPDKPVAGAVQWLSLPDGRYQVTELISAADLGVHDAKALRNQGLPVQLAPREVAIWRMAPEANAPP